MSIPSKSAPSHRKPIRPVGRKPILLSWSRRQRFRLGLHLLRQNPEYEVVALLTTINEQFRRVAIHGFREELLDLQAAAIGLPLWKVDLPFPCSNADYESRMAAVCARAAAEGLHGIAFGDLFLEDIRAYRIARLAGTGLEPIFPVWCPDSASPPPTRPPDDRPPASARISPALTHARSTLFAGRTFDAELLADLPPSVDPCGERGEFHTFAFAGPIFSRTLPVIPGEPWSATISSMPTFSPPPQSRKHSMSPDRARHRRSLLCAAALLLSLAATANAQVLAHPGWTRSGFAAEPWYQRAVFYQVPITPPPRDTRLQGPHRPPRRHAVHRHHRRNRRAARPALARRRER